MATTVVVLSGCSRNSPDAVALDFVKTMQTGKFNEVYLNANCTEKSADWIKNGIKELGKTGMQEFLFSKIKDKVLDTKIEGDKAEVSFETKDSDKMEIPLKRVEGKWKVDLCIQ